MRITPFDWIETWPGCRSTRRVCRAAGVSSRQPACRAGRARCASTVSSPSRASATQGLELARSGRPWRARSARRRARRRRSLNTPSAVIQPSTCQRRTSSAGDVEGDGVARTRGPGDPIDARRSAGPTPSTSRRRSGSDGRRSPGSSGRRAAHPVDRRSPTRVTTAGRWAAIRRWSCSPSRSVVTRTFSPRSWAR